jgi:oxygen-independent coproporphyrinogen-3 oxidase
MTRTGGRKLIMMELSREKLNLYRFLTLKLADDDLYPHYYYGENFSPRQIQGFWKKAVADIVEKKAPQKLGLYVHIPFCRQKCYFCFCDSYVPASYGIAREYLGLLRKEIDLFKDIFRPVGFTSLYFGGGSPSFLNVEDLDWLFRRIYTDLKIKSGAQVIFEGTPRDLNKDNLSLIARNGVNRLTIGVQSLDPRVVKLIRRPQSRQEFIRTFKLARRLGIPYINVDLIAGLEGQSVRSFLTDLKTVLEAGADMIHVTGFTPLAHTPFCRAGKKMSELQKHNRQAMLLASRQILKKAFKEIDSENYGSSQKAENVQETDLRKENSSLLGIGYSSQSHAFGQVWYQHPHVISMRDKPDYSRLPAFFGVRGSLDEEMRKFVFSNLQRGFSRKFFAKIFHKDPLKVFKCEIDMMVKLGKMRVEGDWITSFISARQDFLILSKVFYSRQRIRAILGAHRGEYDKNTDYIRQVDVLYDSSD